MKTRFLVILILLTCFCSVNLKTSHAQSNWTYNGQLNFGGHINLTYSKAQKFPGIKIFLAYSIMGINKNHLVVNYSPSLSIYSKTVGSNFNPLVGDIQIDLINSFSLGYGWGKTQGYFKNFRTIHPSDFYNVSTNQRYMALLTSNFILNNHKRNQIVGTISGTIGDVSFYYANDGAVPFNKIPVADNFDRYWTGSGGIFIHTKKGFNRFEASFDQFTGYTPLLYELSNIIGIDIPLYSENKNANKNSPYTLNTSSYQFKIFTDHNYAIDFGVVGNLMNKKGYHFGIQDLIHIALKYPLHPNNDLNRFFIGASYINQRHEKL